MKPDDILAAAEDLMTRPDSTSAGVWPRAAALMARQAIENAIAQYWHALTETADLASCSMRTQLACLPFYLDRQTARQAAYVWAALSNACHYHSYELAPTAVELTRWITDVRTVIAHIESRGTRNGLDTQRIGSSARLAPPAGRGVESDPAVSS